MERKETTSDLEDSVEKKKGQGYSGLFPVIGETSLLMSNDIGGLWCLSREERARGDKETTHV